MPIVITNRKLSDIDFLERIRLICEKNPRAIILREKDLSVQEYTELGEKVKKICDEYGVKLIINSFIEAARKLEIKNIHIPFPALKDIFLKGEEEILKEFKLIGTSVHSLEEAKEAESFRVSYIIAGHIFKTDCKKGLEPRGLEFLKAICENVKIPVYAIGGINNENTYLAIENGAEDVCIMSSAMTGKYIL